MPGFTLYKLIGSAFFTFLLILYSACDTGSKKVDTNDMQDGALKKEMVNKEQITVGGRTYSVLKIDELTWLGSNLDYQIPESWCYGAQSTDCMEQGRLYRWSGAQEACALMGKGWRLPTEEEWQKLANHFGGYSDWLSEQDYGDPVGANRALIRGGSSGFDATLSGWRGSNGGFDSREKMGFYWTATETNEDEAWFYIVLPEGGKITRRNTNKRMGMACRCVKN